MAYNHSTPPISKAAAEAEPKGSRAFPEESLPATLPSVGDVPESETYIEIRTDVQHRGRLFTVVSRGYTLDELCDKLDKRGYAAPFLTQEWQRLPDGTPICPKHHTPMRLREKQGDTWHSHNVGTREQPVYCKGYHGPDSPGYER